VNYGALFRSAMVTLLRNKMPNTSMKLGVRSFLIVAGVPGDHALSANCQ
jgi:hypothetical protein